MFLFFSNKFAMTTSQTNLVIIKFSLALNKTPAPNEFQMKLKRSTDSSKTNFVLSDAEIDKRIG